jgi:ATP-dependent Clp protease adaptor protein ClpS
VAAAAKFLILSLPYSGKIKLMSGSNPNDEDKQEKTGAGLVLKTRPQTKKPSMYKVLLLNDDYTPMEFVVLVLERFFQKTYEAATQIMLEVHNSGLGLCGIYTHEIAETKVNQVLDFARSQQHPLQCTMEKE